MSIRDTILGRIEAFRARHSLNRSQFGLAAVGDRAFIRQLEQGQPVTLGRIEKAEAFMAAADAGGQIVAAEAGQEACEIGDGVHAPVVSEADDIGHREAVS